MNKEEYEVYKSVVEKTICLFVKKNEYGLTGYESDGKNIIVTITQRIYDRFVEQAEKLGLKVDEALGSLLYGQLMRLSDC